MINIHIIPYNFIERTKRLKMACFTLTFQIVHLFSGLPTTELSFDWCLVRLLTFHSFDIMFQCCFVSYQYSVLLLSSVYIRLDQRLRSTFLSSPVPTRFCYLLKSVFCWLIFQFHIAYIIHRSLPHLRLVIPLRCRT